MNYMDWIIWKTACHCFQLHIQGTLQLVAVTTSRLFHAVARIAAEQATVPTPPSLVQHLVPVPILLVIADSGSGYTASWVAGHQFLTTEAQNQFKRNPREICGRQSDTGTSLSPVVLVCPSIIISLILHTHSPVIWCWYDRFTSNCGTNGPSQPWATDLFLHVYYRMSHTMIIVNMFSLNHTNYMLQYDCTIIRWNIYHPTANNSKLNVQQSLLKSCLTYS